MTTELNKIGEQLHTQDNRITQNPMFCVQVKVREHGFDSSYCDDRCWWNAEWLEWRYEKPEDLEGWEEFGYKDRWETVMVAFTEAGCQEYLNLNGHNHRGEKRIYVESFRRCPEMIAIRELLMQFPLPPAIELPDSKGGVNGIQRFAPHPTSGPYGGE